MNKLSKLLKIDLEMEIITQSILTCTRKRMENVFIKAEISRAIQMKATNEKAASTKNFTICECKQVSCKQT